MVGSGFSQGRQETGRIGEARRKVKPFGVCLACGDHPGWHVEKCIRRLEFRPLCCTQRGENDHACSVVRTYSWPHGGGRRSCRTADEIGLREGFICALR